MSATTLGSLIDDVEARSPSRAPLDLLATAAATADEVTTTADALLSHFVDRARRSGHSWTDIGVALGVTKQAVQKRFTAERADPRGWERFTGRARNVISRHAPAVSEELGHNFIGTEHLLAALFDEPKGVAAIVLTAAGMSRADVIRAIDARVQRGKTGAGSFTPRAWVAIENGVTVALELGHNYVGTEHLLLSMMHGIGGLAEDILTEHGLTFDAARTAVIQELSVFMQKKG